MTQPLKRHFTIGEKQFDVAIHRELAKEIFQRFPKAWTLINSVQKNADVENIDDFIKMLDASEEIIKISKPMIDYALPKMLKLANDKSNAVEIINYCIDNEAEDVFFNKLLETLMLGFTNGITTKKPKIKVVME